MIEQLSNSQAILHALAVIVGPEHVIATDATVSVAPANTEQAAAVLRLANAEPINVRSTGGGSKQSWSDGTRSGIVLDTSRMNALLEHTWQDMTCTVQAGCTWSAMQKALAAHGQFVALDPLWPNRASIGGVVAANDSGALRLKYGSLRDLVIGMTIVLADGTIARTGGKVVKNVAGYDLHKLMIGAFGTLGLMTEMTFRLHSIPAAQQSFTLSCATVEPLGTFLLQLLDSHLSIHALQLRSSENLFSLDLQLATFSQAMDSQKTLLETMAHTNTLQIEHAHEEVWGQRAHLFSMAASSEMFFVKATMLPSEIARFTAIVSETGGASVTQATGIMTAALPVSAVAQAARIRQQLEAAGGSLTVLHLPASMSFDRWGTLPASFPLMERLKQRFDPNHILNPGCFLGGI